MNFEPINFSCEFEKAYNKFTEMIAKGYTIRQISEIYNQSPYRIINRLLDNDNINNLNAIKNYYNSIKIDDNKCLVISDTHIGRCLFNEKVKGPNFILNNEKGLYLAYNYAIKNNIKNIIHTGDLLEGKSNPYTYKISVENQLKYVKRIYPQTNDIKTYLLLGNHDYNLEYFNGIDLMNELKTIKNLEMIGVNYSYINFNNNIIKLSHESKLSSFYDNIDLPFLIELAGHSHMYLIDEENKLIRVPSLSCTHENPSYNGFIELSDEGNDYNIKLFDVNANYKEEKTLSKKINSSYN